MNPAKIRLSAKEMELVTNADWILTKNGILEKVRQLLEAVLTGQQLLLEKKAGVLPAEVLLVAGKISKGENYRGLPYLVLDHPRYFGKKDTLAIRTMFWWGHHFSVTLQLAGRYKDFFQPRLLASFQQLQQGYRLCVSDSEWEHHLGEDNYLPVAGMKYEDFAKYITEKKFLKITTVISLQDWDNAEEKLLNNFNFYLERLGRPLSTESSW